MVSILATVSSVSNYTLFQCITYTRWGEGMVVGRKLLTRLGGGRILCGRVVSGGGYPHGYHPAD